MSFRSAVFAVFAALIAGAPVLTLAQAMPEGYLCCNMRSDGNWISDSNYAENGKQIIPAGTPAKVTGYGRQRVYVELQDKKQAIGNDYSRNLSLEQFAQRYVVADDPKTKLAKYPKRTRDAITGAKILPGMTKEQVLMSVGYPMASENPDLNARIWRYWLTSFAEFQVVFDASDRVKEIVTDAQTRNLVTVQD